MVNKAYIVVNQEQEQKIISNLYDKRSMWPRSPDRNGNYWSPVHGYIEFPYVITDNGERLNWTNIEMLTNEEIVYDGRKEEKMKISKEVYDALVEWKDTIIRHSDSRVFIGDIKSLPGVVQDWIYFEYNEYDEYVVKTSATEINSRLVDVIRWIEDDKVFEVEKPKKWVVRSKDKDGDGEYWYVSVYKGLTNREFHKTNATRFDTKEEAESWANSHQEVIEVEG